MRYLLLMLLLWNCAAQATEQGAQIELAASAATTLENDEVVIRYRIEADGMRTDGLDERVDRIARLIHGQLQAEKKLKLQTLGRRLEIIRRYDKVSRKQVRSGWKLVQTEQLTGSDTKQSARWIDIVEKAGARLDALNFRVSARTARAARQSLRLEAVQRFREQAAAMARALDAPSFRILRLKTTDREPVPPVPRMAMMKVDGQPSLKSGESRISVSVSGTILLPEKHFAAQ